ncbi:MAG TPA: hypothetical protein PLU42_07035 [Spirochaetota bacterium]|nr:hypothetical protein [Spirochaetota bacterium]
MKNILVVATGIVILIGTLTPLKSNEPYIEIEDIYDTHGVLEEWLYPGKYSPVNIFDNDINTIYAEGDDSYYMTIEIKFKNPVECDAIQVLGGVAVNKDIYEKNNRPKDVVVYVYDTDESFLKDKALFEKEIQLKDVMEYQKITFEKTYSIKRFTFQGLGVYKGSKYNDTCITELKFYNKGKEIPVNDVEKLKKEYVKWVGERLKKFFAIGKFRVEEWMGEAYIRKDGGIRYKVWKIGEMNKYIDLNQYPSKYEIKDSRLYMVIQGKEGLVKYELYSVDSNSLIIYSIGDYIYKGGLKFQVVKQ